MTKPSDASLERAMGWIGEQRPRESPSIVQLAALLDAVRDEAMEEAVRAVYDIRHAEDLTRSELAKRIRALKVKL